VKQFLALTIVGGLLATITGCPSSDTKVTTKAGPTGRIVPTEKPTERMPPKDDKVTPPKDDKVTPPKDDKPTPPKDEKPPTPPKDKDDKGTPPKDKNDKGTPPPK
jgi:hypothetical protein